MNKLPPFAITLARTKRCCFFPEKSFGVKIGLALMSRRWKDRYILMLLFVFGLFLGTIGSVKAQPLFFDDFEYYAAREATNVETVFQAHGWDGVKANNSVYRRGSGYIYTQYDATRQSRVLVLEALPTTSPPPPGFPYSQTDFWIGYGGESTTLTTIPANVWFQFWFYATPESRFYKQKFLYPCRAWYPCTIHDVDGDGITDFAWLLGLRNANDDYDVPGSGVVFYLEAPLANNMGEPYAPSRLHQNVNRIPFFEGRWYQVRIHIDISQEQGLYEAWIREKGQTWTKVAEWIGGVTPNFQWPIPEKERVGQRQLKMPTTVNKYDSKVYLDDFTMATSEKDLEGISLSNDAKEEELPGKEAVKIRSILPNPAGSESVTIVLRAQSPIDGARLELYDNIGSYRKTVWNSNFLPNGTTTLTVNIADLPSGLYIFVLRIPQGTATKHFVVTH